ncbi:MAG: cyclic nucleotide-binding domain-containing protein [Elusimicrobiota bacterium]|nr:cyclic nucleotide-binding domain-containing protein [Elusimicrobiota bacterium]
MKKTYRSGEIILEEGTSGSEAYVITSGKVHVFRSKNGKRFTLAVLGANQIFGEMSMIDERPRSASAAALEDTEVSVINHEAFEELSKSDPTILNIFLKSVFERLRHMDQTVLDAAVGISEEGYTADKVLISGLTPEAEAALGGASMEIRKFPFKVGRKTEGGVHGGFFSNNDLYLEDKKPFNISRNHFSIQAKMPGMFIVDRGSALGSIVNDSRVGGASGMSEIVLQPGENILIVGDPESPYKFKITI